jgi:hypothetical protein
MGVVERDWFDPRRLFDEGYPPGITSALRALPTVRQAVREELAAAAGGRILEIGPGDAPVADGLPGAVFMDVAPAFLAPLAGPRVLGDLFDPPFAPRTFDLVVAADVLTHVRPARRAEALARIADLGGDLLLFNPEPGTSTVADSPSPSRPLLAFLEARGYATRARRFVASTPGGDYVMRLVTARPPVPRPR